MRFAPSFHAIGMSNDVTCFFCDVFTRSRCLETSSDEINICPQLAHSLVDYMDEQVVQQAVSLQFDTLTTNFCDEFCFLLFFGSGLIY